MKLLGQEGFSCVRIKGSHHFFLNEADGRTTSVPFHGSRDIGIGLLRQILKDIGWSAEEFRHKLKK